MPKITFKGYPSTVEVPAGTSILDAALLAEIPIEAPCNRTGVCGKCRVRLSPEAVGAVTLAEDSPLHAGAMENGWVPACQTLIQKDMEVLELPRLMEKSADTVLTHGICRAGGLAPFITKTFDPSANRTRVFAGDICVGAESGDTTSRIFGIAVDIGTTTLVASLVDLTTGDELSSASAHNPQSRHAQDVLSRIKFAETQKGLSTLQGAMIDCLNEMILNMLTEASIDAISVYEIVFSGNTCMLHLAAGISPASLGKFPYTPEIKGDISMSATDLALCLSPFARVYLPPVVSAYVGADLTAGILALGLHRMEGISLLVDIGTNGEIILARNGHLTATSTAAGPALEGMNISCGMCAGPGAVEKVRLSDQGRIAFSTIGKSSPEGLCGSGLMDLTAALVERGVLAPSGRFAGPGAKGVHPRFLEALYAGNSSGKAFRLSPGIHLTQKDVRQVQLAKGAIQAGIVFLLRESEIAPEDVDRVLIAGAFGYHLATEALTGIGLLPKAFESKVEYVGNTSKTGAQAFLTNAAHRQEMSGVVEGVDLLELSSHPDFERIFVRSLGF